MHLNHKTLNRWFGDAADGVPPLRNTPARKTATTTATLTAAQMLGEVLTVNQGGSGGTTQTTLTGTLLTAAFAGRVRVGDSFDLFIINISTDGSEDLVLAMGTGITLVGNNDVESESAVTNSASALFRFRNTAPTTWDCMRLA